MRTKWNTDSMRAAITEKVGYIIIPEDFQYKGVDAIETFICPTHGKFQKSCYSILRSKFPCHWCCPNHKKSWSEIEAICKEMHGNKYDYSLCAHNYKPKYKLEIICNEHGMFRQTVSEHLSGTGCMQCYLDKKALSINKFLFESIKIHGDRYDYSSCFDKFINSKSIIKIICKKHGEFNQRAGDHKNGSGCPLCKISNGESAIKNYLIRAGLAFTLQKTFEDLKTPLGKKYRYDFYLPDFNILIEFDGSQHYDEVSSFFDLESIKRSDDIKTEYALRNNIELIRIRDIKNIESILNEKMY